MPAPTANLAFVHAITFIVPFTRDRVDAVSDAPCAAVAATERNARENAVELARVERFDLRRTAAPHADVVVANLMRPLLLRVAELMTTRPRAVIASGLLDEEADEVARALAPLVERRRLRSGGWTALLLAG